MVNWHFDFRTCYRRELGDNEHTCEVENVDSFAQAVKEAVKQLPIGEKDNPYNPKGVEWELQEVRIYGNDEIYTNDI